MKNLHLMWMDSNFNQRLVEVLNEQIPHENNLFVWRTKRTYPDGIDNACVDPSMFTPEAINRQSANWDQIFLHSLYLSDRELLQLSNEAASKIVWVVWGHDLYKRTPKPKRNLHSILYCSYKWMQRYSPFFYFYRKRVADVVRRFRCIAIGYSYDEKYIRKKYGNAISVKYGPYFSKNTSTEVADLLRQLHVNDHHSSVNILVGHCGSPYIKHEKYLRKLSKYRDENIHIYLVLSYLASPERICKLRTLAHSLFGAEKCTILTQALPQDEYFRFLSTIDVAIFPFKIQAALSNSIRLAYIGAKLYLHPKGILKRGFECGGVRTDNCLNVGIIPYKKFIAPPNPVDTNAPLFDIFSYEKNISAWRQLLE